MMKNVFEQITLNLDNWIWNLDNCSNLRDPISFAP